MNLAIFDIDGTLTATNAVDEICFVQALVDVHSLDEINTNWLEYQFVTDSGIIFQIFAERFGRSPDEGELVDFKSCLVKLLQAQQDKDPSLFAEIRGASQALTRLHRETEWAVALATGCWRGSAELKLHAAGIDTRHLPAAFAEDGLSRESILHTTVSHAQQSYDLNRFDRVVSVGDGPWDVLAARNLGIPFVGVGSGTRADKLRLVGATHVLENYVDYEYLLECLREAEVPTVNRVSP